MDPKRSAQDVLRCNLCETSNPQYNCDICNINLCKTCAGEHLLDESKEHKIVPIRQRGYGPDYPSCLKHTKKQCELHCKQCDLPICARVSSDLHIGHKAIDIMKIFDTKNKILKYDLKEFNIFLFPNYHAIISKRKTEIDQMQFKFLTAVNKQRTAFKKNVDFAVQSVHNLKKLLDSNDVYAVSAF